MALRQGAVRVLGEGGCGSRAGCMLECAWEVTETRQGSCGEVRLLVKHHWCAENPSPALFLVKTRGIYQQKKDSHVHQGAVKCVTNVRLVTRTVRLVTMLPEQQALSFLL